MSNLSSRLDRLEQQLDRLTTVLADQASARVRRRRILTIRFLLISVVAFAIVFAAFGSLYRESRRQARAVDQLVGQGAFALTSPRESTLVSLLPGDPEQPSVSLVNILGDDFFRSVTNVSTGRRSSLHRDKEIILQSVADLTELKRLRLTNLALRSDDLRVLENLNELQSIDLTRTGLDSGAMPWLRSTQMRWFNASHTCIGDQAMVDLAHCGDLQQLFLERTCVTDEGIGYLRSLSNLRYVNLKRSPVSARAVQELSDALPNCYIEWEPLRFTANGKVDAGAARSGRLRLGRRMPEDPRASRRAYAPLDSAPVPVTSPWMTTDSFRLPTFRSPGFMLDVF